MQKRIIRAADAKQIDTAKFRSFDRRPVNYFRDVLTDEAREAALQLNEQEMQERIEAAVVAERQRMQELAKREAQDRFKAGLAQGRSEASGEFKRGVELLNEYARMLQAERKEMLERYEQSAVKLAFTLAEKVIGQELETDPKAVAQIARNAIAQVTDAQQLTLRVNPQDAEYLKSMQADLMTLLSSNAQLDIRGDQSVRRGGCLVESEQGTLDARIESQLATLRIAVENSASDGEQN
jgi:flagellar assembly protein FliH